MSHYPRPTDGGLVPGHEQCLVFQKRFGTDELQCLHVGRLEVGEHHAVRIILTPRGIQLGIPKSAITDGSVVVFDDHPDDLGLGSMPSKEESTDAG
jgi:hypothetical protein